MPAFSPQVEAPGRAVCTLRVGGMDCSSCAESVERALRQLDGVQDVRVDVVGERVTVGYVEGKLTRGDLVSAITRVGYRVEDETPAGDDIAPFGTRARRVAEERRSAAWSGRRAQVALVVLAGLLWALSLVAEYALGIEALAAAAAVGAVVAGGRYVFPRGIRAAMQRALDMNFLMSIAAVGALLIGEYEEAGSVMFLYAVAQLLEGLSMDRARNAIRALMGLSPTEATVLRDGREVRVPVERVAIGETIVVRPGEKIPVDGVVLAGTSSVNQAPITGESMPVEKAPGSEVFAGTLNGEGALEVRST